MNLGKKRIVVEACKNYYDIINEKYTQDDTLTKSILETYKQVIDSTDPDDFDLLHKTVLFDESVYTYFNNEEFKNMIVNELNVELSLLDFMLEQYNTYKSNLTDKVPTTRWI